jgi:hypothetical protein
MRNAKHNHSMKKEGAMRLYCEIAKIDAEQRLVMGYASTEALDDQGEVVKRDALAAALGDYMKFANIREMHEPSAVGVAKEAAIDEKGLYLAAHVVPPAFPGGADGYVERLCTEDLPAVAASGLADAVDAFFDAAKSGRAHGAAVKDGS